MTVALVHRYVGLALVLAFLAIMGWGLGLRLAGRDEEPVAFRGLQHWTENVLLANTAFGVVLLLVGRRVVGVDLAWLHYLYGSLFPLLAIVAGRIAGLRRESRAYVGMAWGAFFAFGLTLRAATMGLAEACGSDVFRWDCIF